MDEQRQDPTNVQIVAASGIAAAIIAGLVVLFSRRQKKPLTRIERLTARADAIRGDAVERAQRLTHDAKNLASSAESQAQSWQKMGKKRAKKMAGQVDPDRLKEAGGAVESEIHRLTDRTKGLLERGAKSGRESAKTAKKDAKKAGSESASSLQGIIAQAVASALSGMERARESGTSLAESARDHMPSVNQKAGGEMVASIRGKVEEDVVPSLRDVAFTVASVAADLWHGARERVSDGVPVDVEGLSHRAAKVVGIGGDRAKDASSTVADKASEMRDRAKDATRRTADATVDTSKDSGALLFWTGAAAALIFYVLLDEERRDQLTRFAAATTAQAQELLRDFQGYDDEF